MSGVFKIKKALFPKDKNWEKIKQINKAKKARFEQDARSVGLEPKGLTELLQPIDKAFPELRMSRRKPVDAEGDGADDVPALAPKRSQRSAPNAAENPSNGISEEGETVLEMLEHPLKVMSKVYARRKEIMWFYKKGRGDNKGTFRGWAD